MTLKRFINIQCQVCNKEQKFESITGKNWDKVEKFKAEHFKCGDSILIITMKENNL